MTDQNPWLTLAAQLREIAALAEQYATTPPGGMAPAEGFDALADLDDRALTLRGTVAACRRHTWQQLHAEGLSYAAIGRLWGKTRAAVHNSLLSQERAR